MSKEVEVRATAQHQVRKYFPDVKLIHKNRMYIVLVKVNGVETILGKRTEGWHAWWHAEKIINEAIECYRKYEKQNPGENLERYIVMRAWSLNK